MTRSDPAARRASATDAQFLLKVMCDEWQSVFRTRLGHNERSYVSELRDVRNRWAHQDVFSGDDAHRALDSAHRLRLAVSAAEEAIEVDRMRQDLLRARFGEQSRQTQRKSATVAVEGQPATGPKPWREVVTPIPTWPRGATSRRSSPPTCTRCGGAKHPGEYGQPVEFFRRTL